MSNFLRHLFIPHETNDQRAKILHIDSIILTIALLIFSFSIISSLQNKYPTVLGIAHRITTEELISITNKYRQEHGVAPVIINKELSNAAQEKATDMLTKNYWAHVAPDGITPWSFIRGSGYDYMYAGENLGRGFTNAKDLVDAWMASPSHRDNMLSEKYKEVGFAVVTGNLTGSDTVLIVEMFGTRYVESEGIEPIARIQTPQAQLVLISPTPILTNENPVRVAAISQQPLIDKNDLTKNILFSIISLLIIVLMLDAFIIERKKIIRSVSHNFDHAFYLFIIFLTIIAMGRGTIL
jgi:uncharacterized protein YkwD